MLVKLYIKKISAIKDNNKSGIKDPIPIVIGIKKNKLYNNLFIVTKKVSNKYNLIQ